VLELRRSLSLLIEGLKEGLISYAEALKGLDRLADVMYPSSSVYKLALKEIEKMEVIRIHLYLEPLFCNIIPKNLLMSDVS